MARRTFFSFHYQRDVWRVNQIRNVPNVMGCYAAGFQDASLWEAAKRKSDATIEALIDKALEDTTVTVVFVGAKTAGRKFINYEIDESIKRGNGLLAVQIHRLEDQNKKTDVAGAIPHKLTSGGYPAYTYRDVNGLSSWIEAAAKRAGK